MAKYKVRLTADAIVSATIVVEASDIDEAKRIALERGKDESLYEVDSLHEEPEVYEAGLDDPMRMRQGAR